MKPERWAQIQKLFDAAVEMEPQARVAYLETICQDDADLRREIESLLEAHKDADFLERSSREIGRKLSPTLQPGDRLHQYQILFLLGAGGMGEVYLALDTRLHRRVALKLLPRNSNLLRDQLRRFEQEARAASALSHPNHEAESGDHYIAMEHVEAESLCGSGCRDRSRSRKRWGLRSSLPRRSPQPIRPASFTATSSLKTSCFAPTDW